MSVYIPNEYKEDYEKIEDDYELKYSKESFIDTIISKKELPNSFWMSKLDILDIKTLKGKKKLPYQIGVVIMYHKNEELIKLYYECMRETNITDILTSKFKGYYEFKSKKIKEKYDDITYYYQETYDKILKNKKQKEVNVE